MTMIGHRIHPGLIYINGEPCMKTKARKATTCVHSREPIVPGDEIYRPLSSSPTRSARYLAREIERIERKTP